MLLDAGGGTVDVNTYTVSQTTPLRLSREVIRPDGESSGNRDISFPSAIMTLMRRAKADSSGPAISTKLSGNIFGG